MTIIEQWYDKTADVLMNSWGKNDTVANKSEIIN